MDLVLSLPACLQEFLFVELLADLSPLFQVRLVSRRYRFEADRVLSRLTRELRSQENYWVRELQGLRQRLASELLPSVLSTLRRGAEWNESQSCSADCTVVVAGMKFAGLMSGGVVSDFYPLWEWRPERLPTVLKDTDFLHLPEEAFSHISDLQVSDEDLKSPLALTVNRFTRAVKELRTAPRFLSIQRRFLALERLQAIHTRLLRVLMRLHLMKTNQFFPESPLQVLISGAESEAKAIYDSTRFHHC